MRIKIFTGIIAISFGSILSSCSDRPKHVISDSEMVKVMADIEMAQAYIQSRGYRDQAGSNRERVLEYILAKNGMTREDFDSTISWYGRHIDKYDDLYSKVDRELARRESKISGNSVELLSNDLWPYSRHLVISPLSTTDNLYFNIPGTDLIKGDRLTWKFTTNLPVDGRVIFGITYTDGVTSYISSNTNGKNNEFIIQTDSSKVVKNIFGNMRVKDNRNVIGIDSLMLYSTPYDSLEYYKINTHKRYLLYDKRKKLIEKNDSIVNTGDSIQNNAIM